MAVTDILCLPYNSGVLKPIGSALVIGAPAPQVLFGAFLSCDVIQFFNPHAMHFDHVLTSFDKAQEGYDHVLIVLPKNMTEARYWLAHGLSRLKYDGALVVAADNKAGGGRIKKLFAEMGFETPQDQTKNRIRVVWARKKDDQNPPQDWLKDGGIQKVLDGEFNSQPGIFGWDKIDQGSALLAELIPEDLSGEGADFGCGYGFLSRAVLDLCPDVERLHCIDADARAVQMCEMNVGEKAQYHWLDLTQKIPLQSLDFVIMNPPFHEGKNTDAMIGKDFIRTAHQSLKSGGVLLMVANAHLPYEDVLKSLFSTGHKLHEGHGFKIYAAFKALAVDAQKRSRNSEHL